MTDLNEFRPAYIGFGMRDELQTVNHLHWYKDKICKGCGERFLALIEQQDYCSDFCKWHRVRPAVLRPVHTQEEKKGVRLPKVLVGYEYCIYEGCTHYHTSLVWTDKRVIPARTYTRDYAVQSESPYGCNGVIG